MDNYNDFDMDDYGDSEEYKSELKYKELNIIIRFDIEESKKHLDNDYSTLINEGIEKLILEEFIPWLKGTEYLDRDNEKILEGLKPYEITYNYHKIIDKYSPTGKDDYFGEFEIYFESGNEYTRDILEAVAMQIYINDNKVVKVSGYDI